MVIRLTIFENKDVKDETAKKELSWIVQKFPSMKDFININGSHLKVKNYVGVLQTKNSEIDILPKIWIDEGKNDEENFKIAKKNFLNLFSYAVFEPKFFEPYRYLLEERKITDIREFIVLLFAFSLNDNLNKGLYRTYVKRRYESNYLRGKLLLKECISKFDKSKLIMQQYNLDANNKLNQILSYASYYFNRGQLSYDVKEKLLQISGMFDSESIERVNHKNLSIGFNRMNERFEIPYNYASVLLKGSSISTGGKNGGNKKEMMFLYNMDNLFEKFLYNFIKRNKEVIFKNFNCYSSLNINYNESKRNFIFDPKNNRYKYETRPDIKIKCGSINIIIDAKNKSRDNEEMAKQGDLYQMFTYSMLYNADSILFYPFAKKEHSPIKGPYKFYKESEHRLWISTLNLDFSEGWKNRLAECLRNDFERVLEINTK